MKRNHVIVTDHERKELKKYWSYDDSVHPVDEIQDQIKIYNLDHPETVAFIVEDPLMINVLDMKETTDSMKHYASEMRTCIIRLQGEIECAMDELQDKYDSLVKYMEKWEGK